MNELHISEIRHDEGQMDLEWTEPACSFCDQLLDADGRCAMCEKADEIDDAAKNVEDYTC